MLIGDRYEVVRELGRGAQGSTWLAVDLETSARVVVKELLLGLVESWKGVELFEREGAALRTISHVGVPAYFDSFRLEEEGRTRFLLVQEFVDGEDLQASIGGGLRMGEGELRVFLREMGEILRYLHGLSPAVIHRDIKPSNIMQNRKGRFLLVDFGAVQAVQPDRVGGSTVVGTSGYMPAEQLVGRAGAGSDLYALGATAVHLASGVRPGDLPMSRMRIVWRDRVDLSGDLMDLVDAMLEPSVSLRLGSAQDLLDGLDGKKKVGGKAKKKGKKGGKRRRDRLATKKEDKKGRHARKNKGNGAVVVRADGEILVVQASPWTGVVVVSGFYGTSTVIAVMKFGWAGIWAVLMGSVSVLGSVLGWGLLGVLGVLWLMVWRNNSRGAALLAQEVVGK